jgi:hypothetical protein
MIGVLKQCRAVPKARLHPVWGQLNLFIQRFDKRYIAAGLTPHKRATAECSLQGTARRVLRTGQGSA